MPQKKPGVTPSVSHIKIPRDGKPYIEGVRCGVCGAIYTGKRWACPKCGNREEPQTIALEHLGKIHTYSIVHRSYPGVQTPFISAVVALDGGGSVQATIRGVDIDSKTPLFGRRVQLIFEESTQRDENGDAYMTYHFKPVAA